MQLWSKSQFCAKLAPPLKGTLSPPPSLTPLARAQGWELRGEGRGWLHTLTLRRPRLGGTLSPVFHLLDGHPLTAKFCGLVQNLGRTQYLEVPVFAGKLEAFDSPGWADRRWASPEASIHLCRLFLETPVIQALIQAFKALNCLLTT